MKAVILAGGFGTRLAEETDLKPKPMVEIGGKPILWHIMKTYAHYNITDFIICCGYKGYAIKEYFANYYIHNSDVTFDLKNNTTNIHSTSAEPWKITLVDTGLETMTGGRLKRVSEFVGEDETFCFTYGDGVGDVNIDALIKNHFEAGKIATLTATRPKGRYGTLEHTGDGTITSFSEKQEGKTSWINGGYFVLQRQVFEYIIDDTTTWEEEPLALLAKQNQLNAYFHEGFWQPMDTLREKQLLNALWEENSAPWKVWS